MRRQKYLYVYILRCIDNSYYTGVTFNLELRVRQHNFGIDKDAHTYSRRPVLLEYYERFSDFRLAIQWEKKIKRWSRKKKEALISANWDKLKQEAICKNETSHKLYTGSKKTLSGRA